MNTDTLFWNERYLLLAIRNHKDLGYWTFHIEILGTEEECSQFGDKMAVHQVPDRQAIGKFVAKFSGEPCHVEKNKDIKSLTGLVVTNDVMKSKMMTKSEKDGRMDFRVSIVLTKE